MSANVSGLEYKEARNKLLNMAKKHIIAWEKDWEKNPKKAICKELGNKKVIVNDICFNHLEKAGSNSVGSEHRARPLGNLKRHIQYILCAKEILEGKGVKSENRFERKENGKTLVYHALTGIAPEASKHKYVTAIVSQKKMQDGSLGDAIYLSTFGHDDFETDFKEEIKKALWSQDFWIDERWSVSLSHQNGNCSGTLESAINHNQSSSNIGHFRKNVNNFLKKSDVNMTMEHVTLENRDEKIEKMSLLIDTIRKYHSFEKAGWALEEDAIKKGGPKKEKGGEGINISFKDLDPNDTVRMEKALRSMSFTLDVPLKAAKGEAFQFTSQEELTDKWCAFFSNVTRSLYDMIIGYFSLPEITVMSKSDKLTYKGKVLYSPETGKPITQKEWTNFVKTLEAFLNKGMEGASERITLESHVLGKILNRMLKYNTLEEVQKKQLKDIVQGGKRFDWISESVKHMKDAFGGELSRGELARIEIMQQSAGIRIQKVCEAMRSDIQQTLIDGVKGRMSRSRVSQDIFDRMVGHNRDFQRIADTEIQNAVNNANVREIVNETPLGKPVYLKRIEIVDSNTCAYCKRMNGVVAKWSDVPLESDRIKDAHASYALWEGKEWNGKGHNFSIGVFHPYCRGTWVKYSEDDRITDGYAASIFGRGKKWKESVEKAKKEYKEKGIENPDDTTEGYTERINELMNEEVKKAFPTLEIESIEKSGVPVGYISGNYKKISDNPSKWAWIPKEK